MHLFRCGEIVELSTHGHYCSCDDLCVFYRDCCYDYEMWCPQEHLQAWQLYNDLPDPEVNVVCADVPVPSEDSIAHNPTAYVSLVKGCPNNTQPPVYHDTNPLLYQRIPVADGNTGILYYDVTFAECNGVTNIVPMGVRHGCHVSPFLFNATSTVDVTDDVIFVLPAIDVLSIISPESCSMRPIILFDAAIPRPCSDAVDTPCPDTCENTKLVNLCNSPIQTLAKSDFIFYNNYYCAMCHTADQPSFLVQLPQCSEYLRGSQIGFSFGNLLLVTLRLSYDAASGLQLHSVDGIDCLVVPQGQYCDQLVCPSGYAFDQGQCRKFAGVLMIVRTKALITIDTTPGVLEELDNIIKDLQIELYHALTTDPITDQILPLSATVNFSIFQVPSGVPSLLALEINMKIVAQRQIIQLSEDVENLADMLQEYIADIGPDIFMTYGNHREMIVKLLESSALWAYWPHCQGIRLSPDQYTIVNISRILLSNGVSYNSENLAIDEGGVILCGVSAGLVQPYPATPDNSSHQRPITATLIILFASLLIFIQHE